METKECLIPFSNDDEDSSLKPCFDPYKALSLFSPNEPTLAEAEAVFDFLAGVNRIMGKIYRGNGENK